MMKKTSFILASVVLGVAIFGTNKYLNLKSKYDIMMQRQSVVSQTAASNIDPKLLDSIKDLYSLQASRQYDKLENITSGYLKHSILSHKNDKNIDKTTIQNIQIIDSFEKNNHGIVKTKVYLKVEGLFANIDMSYYDVYYFKEDGSYMFYNMKPVNDSISQLSNKTISKTNDSAIIFAVTDFLENLANSDYKNTSKYTVRSALSDIKKHHMLYGDGKKMKFEFTKPSVKIISTTQQFAVVEAKYNSKMQIGNKMIKENENDVIFYLENTDIDKQVWKIYEYVSKK